ncbi:MAG: nucleoside triphosphate pyrophosphohydrolase [Treponema sp.]|nr:nucleoside triphosphate pyrophosphohydrolase [Treponema sp.]
MEKTFNKDSVLERRGQDTRAYDEDAARTAAAFCRLYELIRILRAPGGCPWDREQNPMSMRRDLIEEVFEAVDAISSGDAPHAKEELGDVFLNTTMISYMYRQQLENGNDGWTLEDELNELVEKLIRRHPHVFTQSEGKAVAEGPVNTSKEVLAQWDKIKEKVEGREKNSILDEVPQGFPPLLRAYKMQKKAAKKGFDWPSLEPTRQKILEELKEVDEAAADFQKDKSQENQVHLEEEIGDLFFAAVNYARKLGVDPEIAMNAANKKFYKRFSYVEEKCREENVEMVQDNLSQMDKFWDQAKKEL